MLLALVCGAILGWETTCGIKVAHGSEALAADHATRLSGCRPYPCTWCYRWHVGHPLERHFIRHLMAEADRRRGDTP